VEDIMDSVKKIHFNNFLVREAYLNNEILKLLVIKRRGEGVSSSY
jgi:hypothetical protein